MANKKYLLLILLIIAILFAPFLISPKLLTEKDNDLGRTYVPLFNFIRESVYKSHQIPLWRPDQFMGETFVGNPLSSLFYPANIIFLIFSVESGAIIYFFIHILIAAISTFYLSKSFSLSNQGSLVAALFYSLSTKILVHIEAGHITMVAAFSLLPFSLLALRKILENYQFKWLVALASSLSLMYMAYPTIFYYALIFISLYWVYHALKTKPFHKKFLFKNILYFFSALIIALCGSAIVLLPHLEFAPLSTRSSLSLEDVALPIWSLKKIFLSLAFPYLDKTLTHEEFLYIGIIPTTLSLIGFLILNKFRKAVLSIGLVVTMLYILGLSTPFFEALYNFLPYLKFLRVTTRLWFVVVLIAALLSALVINKIKSRKLIAIITGLFLLENAFIFTSRNYNVPTLNFKNEKIYQFLSNDHDFFRVYCTTYCFNPQLITRYNIEVLHGESPIQHSEFIEFLERAGKYDWKKFAVIFPPYQIWQNPNPPTPNAALLAEANVKYVASTYSLRSQNFSQIGEFDKVFLYKNNLYKPRFYFQDSNQKLSVSYYSPNAINIKFETLKNPQILIASQNYYPGWIASVINQQFTVEKSGSVLSRVVIPQGSEDVWLKFQPKSFIIGRTITVATLIFILLAWPKLKSKSS